MKTKLPTALLGLLLMGLSLASLGFGPPKLVDSATGDNPIYQQQLRLLSQGTPPTVEARAQLIIDVATGKVAWGRNIHQRLAPASTTKIMTAIVAMEKGNLNDRIVIKPKHMIEGSSMGLQPGDVVTLEDLLWGLLLPSGNDAALAIADLVGGSTPNFVKMMNDKALELGLEDTHFTTPHGLDEPGHYSSAYDLAVMSRYALKKPLFARIVATSHQVVQANRTFNLENANQLLEGKNSLPGVNGIKTGLTDDAGDCLVASVTRNSHQVIVVVMGTPARGPAATRLINFAFEQFTWVPLRPPLFSQWLEGDGKAWDLTLGQSWEEMVPLWQRFSPRLAVNLRRSNGLDPSLPWGMASYFIGDSKIAELALFPKITQH
ncbi:MAG: D-alanyl-D-alanine carboxypeptidase [Chloroflexi bacterium]|nr:D-alanyl-D-alanine carboxypeptidase [Chloroflexota bacterium]